MKILLLAVLVFITSAAFFLTAKKVECYTQFGLCDEKFYSLSQKLKNTRLLWPLPQKTAQQLFTSPPVKTVTLHRRLPNTLIVSLVLTRPVGIVSSVLGDSVAIDDTGQILGAASASGLPVLIVDQPLSESPLDHRYPQALLILTQIASLFSQPISAKLERNTLVAYVHNSPQIVISLDKLDQNWYTALQVIWERSKIEGKKPQKIDLRFKNPVLTY